MNIFVLDKDNSISVQYYVNSHIVKMPLETAQLLCSAHHCTNSTAPYKLAFKNHPCSVWARQSLSNYTWLVDLGINICKEYTFRYGKIHKCQEVIEWCGINIPCIKDVGITNFVKAMPEKYKTDNAVNSYRNYYNGEKRHLFFWKYREKPWWINEK